MRTQPFIGIFALGAMTVFGVGCVAHAQAGGYAEADPPVIFTEEPTLVEVEPGIWVVRDYDDSVYYVDGSYWVYRRDHWYRSPSYDRGWVAVEVSAVPHTVSHRDHHAYVHYRGAANAPMRKAPRERLAAAPERDPHRPPPGHAGEPHAGPRGEAQPGGGPSHDDRPVVDDQRRRPGDDDHHGEEVKRDNDGRRGDGKRDDRKNDDHRKR